LGVIISWTIASWLSDSLYDSILSLRGIPLLPVSPKHPTNWAVTPPRPFNASDLMVDIAEYGFLNDRCSAHEVALMLEHSSEIFFPVLAKGKHKNLLGEVSRQILEEELKRFGYARHTQNRQRLLRAATKKLQRERTAMMRIKHFKSENNRERAPQSTENQIRVRDESHFSQSLLERAEIEEVEEEKSGLRSWDEKGYLRRRREEEEWLDFGDKEKWTQHMNISPVTVIPTMPISQIYILFHVLHCDKIYVAKRNELVGVIDEQILLERERLERKGKKKRQTRVGDDGDDDALVVERESV